MLVLSRRVGEQLVIAGDIVLTVIEVRGDGVRLGIDAPRSVRIHRAEVLDAVRSANAEAAAADDGTEAALRRLLPASPADTGGGPSPEREAAGDPHPVRGQDAVDDPQPAPGQDAVDDSQPAPGQDTAGARRPAPGRQGSDEPVAG